MQRTYDVPAVRAGLVALVATLLLFALPGTSIAGGASQSTRSASEANAGRLPKGQVAAAPAAASGPEPRTDRRPLRAQDRGSRGPAAAAPGAAGEGRRGPPYPARVGSSTGPPGQRRKRGPPPRPGPAPAADTDRRHGHGPGRGPGRMAGAHGAYRARP